MFSKIEQVKQQLERQRAKNNKLLDVILLVQQKLKRQLLNSKNIQERSNSEIALLRQQIAYKVQQFQRITDNSKITFQNNHQQRVKIIQKKYKAEIQMIKKQLQYQRHLNHQKTSEIGRLYQKIRRFKLSEQNNNRFSQTQKDQLKNSTIVSQQKYKILMQQRQRQLFGQFKRDLQYLHQQQKEEIIILCDRIRILKIQLQDKNRLIKQFQNNQNNYMKRDVSHSLTKSKLSRNQKSIDKISRIDHRHKSEISQLQA